MKNVITKILLVVAIPVLTGAAILWFNRGDAEIVSPYRFVNVDQGDVEFVVSSTGTLDAVTTVEVGTQVSGIISDIYVDFNDRVRRGQVIARIDPTLLESAVADAEANMERNQAQLRQAERELERIKGLYEKQFITEVEYNQALYELDIAQATDKSSRISLDRAQQNLSYATIHAPISGTVVERNVDVGQTVAASFSAPLLFLIADDLSRMEILASVDESDIGLIKQGQQVRFTVQAYEDQFEGVVRQVRLQSTSQENVVNYTVVVDVDNGDGRLLPGMTATVDFLIESVSNVYKIPNAALRFRPTPEMMAYFREQRKGAQPDSTAGRPAGASSWQGRTGGQSFGAPGGAMAFGAGRPSGANFTLLWHLDEQGDLAVIRARSGITDGQMTEVEGRGLESGMQIIAGVRLSEDGGSLNPFQNNQQRRFRPGGF